MKPDRAFGRRSGHSAHLRRRAFRVIRHPNRSACLSQPSSFPFHGFHHASADFLPGRRFSLQLHSAPGGGPAGRPFPTPFATPRGVGLSSPLVNFLWGAFNLAVGLLRFERFPISLGLNPECAAMALGALLLGIYLSRHFGKVRREAGW
ncbi:hypothetical protein [Burkholderia gladioli]|uniref:hypothetical protein n=1 Tax=Burkholderia gladioli TaxID=28095 RepID=UPI003132A4C2